MPDEREQFWLEQFRMSARGAQAENAANIYSEHGWYARQDAFRSILGRLAQEGRLQPGMRAADMGCGTGAYTRILAEHGCRTVGLDLCEEMLSNAAQRAAGTCAFAAANSLVLPIRENSFELITSVGMIQHLADVEPFLRECRRVLTARGTVVLMTLNSRTVRRLLHRFSRPSAEDLASERLLRRYVVPRLRDQVRGVMSPCRIQVHPVFVFPAAFRRWESLFDRLPCGGLFLPLAVSLALSVRLEGVEG